MNTSLVPQTSPFVFESHDVRTLTHENGEIWFVLADILAAIGSSTQPHAAISSIKEGLGDGGVTNTPIPDALGRPQDTVLISESGATYLLANSRTEAGKKLNRFIHNEVLPAIRKTGSYSLEDRGGQNLVTAFDQKLAALHQENALLRQEAAAAHQQTLQQLVAMEERIQGYAATLAGQSLEQAAETKTKLELVHSDAQAAKSAVHASLKEQRDRYPEGLTLKQYVIIHHCEEYAKLIRQRVKQMVKDLDPEGRLGLEGTTMTATRPGQVKADPTYPVCLLDLAFLIVLAEKTRTSTKDQMAELMSRKLHPNQKT